MSSSRGTWWRRWLQRSPLRFFLFRKGPVCRNWHWRWDRYCYCCLHEHCGDWNGGIYDLKNHVEIEHYWRCAHCGGIKFFEEEVWCWACGKGEMVYRG